MYQKLSIFKTDNSLENSEFRRAARPDIKFGSNKIEHFKPFFYKPIGLKKEMPRRALPYEKIIK